MKSETIAAGVDAGLHAALYGRPAEPTPTPPEEMERMLAGSTAPSQSRFERTPHGDPINPDTGREFTLPALVTAIQRLAAEVVPAQTRKLVAEQAIAPAEAELESALHSLRNFPNAEAWLVEARTKHAADATAKLDAARADVAAAAADLTKLEGELQTLKDHGKAIAHAVVMLGHGVKGA